ncbi:translation factor, Sua5/YciO/YrdC/YwlC family [Mycoplasma haemocanis str. Illinois]|uniref:L-threonylcarbamoyladenylate synthase n=1 Tax=Mycoplasma haemocanis (strain Illinois) TaxID=1111676 RepID=H6N5V6_MYCHN|nr:Sua5/YciO/YrdC/YwlC family protein [Mycoplasma haemocanis]AEW44871.2 translation factor, Sua5/YciO/YrdC/YwlC family [Mycoplasma haemocanis str. Illinois]
MIEIWVELIKSGKAAIIATDSVFGIISKNKDLIYSLKKRPREKKLILFISSVEELPSPIPKDLKKLAESHWPGTFTIIYKGQGYRIPNSNLLIEILKRTGSLWSSSANLSGDSVVKSLEEAKNIFGKEVLYIESEVVPAGTPSTIYDYDNKKLIRK